MYLRAPRTCTLEMSNDTRMMRAARATKILIDATATDLMDSTCIDSKLIDK
jgi:anti-anti-sigma regulatory factor